MADSGRFRRSYRGGALVVALTVLLTTLLTGASSGPGAVGGGAPRVMTYNIQHGAGMDGVFDLRRTAGAITAAHPDIVALQEVDVHWGQRSGFADEARRLADALGMHVFFAPIYDFPPPRPDAPRRQYGVAILSRYPILAAFNHEITRESSQNPGAPPAPAPGFAQVTVSVAGRPVSVYDTHLDSAPDPAVRRMQVRDMLAIMRRDPAAKILAGDFNAGPQAPELGPLLAAMRDVWAVVGQPHPPSYPAGQPVKPIDFITVSAGLSARNPAVLDTRASDHRPELVRVLPVRTPR